ncbi:MAG TPA: aldehyde ferredoxin oxidoreductase family protein [Deltaproteobacteria bacterium]|nr:aldehyde ferredoxin oxidoreductase family protein [Deltaproteobacteria bacterium]HPP79586.1 aldehyde ferredoxin oxidoreductase family protein [Deltaproteobacteria bacterium]
MYGYHGRFLRVDLDRLTCEDMPIPEEVYRKYIGGATLGAHLIAPHVRRGMDPLAGDAPLVFAVGPLTLSPIPMVSRYAVAGVSPLTGFWGEATSGGDFPFRLKGAGYDGVFVTGRAEKPVYLLVEDGTPSIRDAAHLWGKNAYETQEEIRRELGTKGLGMAAIGEAGERLVKTAGIQNDAGRMAGRCGLGALMGSKNLKAVVASGNKRPPHADPAGVSRLAREAHETIRMNFLSIAYREYGTLLYSDMAMTLADVPARYFTKSVFPVEKVTGQALRQRYTVENYACAGCPIGCGRVVKNFDGSHTIDGPEYETVMALGPLCMNFDLDSIIRANHLCNAHGIDTIAAGVAIAYAMYLYEKGVISREEAGMEIRWGDGQAVVRLVEMIVKGEGIGRLLARGTLAMARHYGRDESEAAQIKGMEIPMHDPRAFHGMAISYATGPRGACHLKGDYYSVELGTPVLEYMILPGDRLSSEGKAESAAKYQNLKDLYDALTLCKFSPLSVTQICAIMKAVTGWEVTPDELLVTGERSINLKRVINNVLGVTSEHDRVPGICLEPLEEGSTAGTSPDMELMLKEYYEFRGWDRDTGRPARDRLERLGLEKEAKLLYG